jgi:hypothetical protein
MRELQRLSTSFSTPTSCPKQTQLQCLITRRQHLEASVRLEVLGRFLYVIGVLRMQNPVEYDHRSNWTGAGMRMNLCWVMKTYSQSKMCLFLCPPPPEAENVHHEPAQGLEREQTYVNREL